MFWGNRDQGGFAFLFCGYGGGATTVGAFFLLMMVLFKNIEVSNFGLNVCGGVHVVGGGGWQGLLIAFLCGRPLLFQNLPLTPVK